MEEFGKMAKNKGRGKQKGKSKYNGFGRDKQGNVSVLILPYLKMAVIYLPHLTGLL